MCQLVLSPFANSLLLIWESWNKAVHLLFASTRQEGRELYVTPLLSFRLVHTNLPSCRNN